MNPTATRLAVSFALILVAGCDSGMDPNTVEEAPWVAYSGTVSIGPDIELPAGNAQVWVSLGDRNVEVADLFEDGQTSLQPENKIGGAFPLSTFPSPFEMDSHGEPFSGQAIAILDVDDNGLLSPATGRYPSAE